MTVRADLPGLAYVNDVDGAKMPKTFLPAKGIADIVPCDPIRIWISNLGDLPVCLQKRLVVASACTLVGFVLSVDGMLSGPRGHKHHPNQPKKPPTKGQYLLLMSISTRLPHPIGWGRSRE